MRPRNDEYTVHLWENDVSGTICGIPEETAVVPHGNHAVSLCDDCFHISAGHVRYDPTPAEREFIEAVLGA